MAQTLTELFGANATRTGSQITIDAGDFDPNLDAPTTATPEEIMASFLKWLVDTTQVSANDKTKGIAANEFQNDFAFVNRDGEIQVQQSYTINVHYVNPITNLDPDNVIQ